MLAIGFERTLYHRINSNVEIKNVNQSFFPCVFLDFSNLACLRDPIAPKMQMVVVQYSTVYVYCGG